MTGRVGPVRGTGVGVGSSDDRVQPASQSSIALESNQVAGIERKKCLFIVSFSNAFLNSVANVPSLCHGANVLIMPGRCAGEALFNPLEYGNLFPRPAF
jgi:hypothetical protein